MEGGRGGGESMDKVGQEKKRRRIGEKEERKQVGGRATREGERGNMLRKGVGRIGGEIGGDR